ncbi:SDR family NAD(P)-dependent oxidoreductase [Paraglaciecola sp. L3A3]|uniref:SDR family NAD(P)-dependent oxidoreductase n=1 Tax=Paraglaciecola sp. L3A3 TaxID=2686358 RepID=UPI00131BF7E8|nr:SDR family NAD(P)-dependent oxidoreductase [Paraglaciecola sp. L3A3]
MNTVLITGATSGIGRALVATYVNQGYDVFAAGRNPTKLAELKADFAAITPLQFDVSDLQQVLVVANDLPPINQLILNAGNCEYMDTVYPFDSELFERVIRTNLLSVGYCLQAFLPKLGSGSQLGIVSSSVTYLAFTQAQAYGASKAGLNYLARSLSVDLADKKIGVSLIQPGFVETPLTDKNTFDMPAKVTAKFAAETIFKGMQAKKLTIRFPTLFIATLRLMSLLPFSWWRKIAISMVKK